MNKPSRHDRIDFYRSGVHYIAFIDGVAETLAPSYVATVALFRELAEGSLEFARLGELDVSTVRRTDDTPELFVSGSGSRPPEEVIDAAALAAFLTAYRGRYGA